MTIIEQADDGLDTPGGRSHARRAVNVTALGFFLLYGLLMVRRYGNFRIPAFDLGIFDQGLWLLSVFRDPFVTVRGLPLFADHASFVMVLLTPLYWLWSDPRALILFTVAVLAAIGPMTYRLARALGLSPRWAAALAIGALLHPALAWNARDSFHPEVVAVPLLVAAYLAAVGGRQGWVWAAVIPVLMAKEDAGLVVVPFGLVVAFVLGRRRLGLAVAGAGAVAFALAFGVLLPALSPTGELLYTDRYAALGDGFGGILSGLATRPQDWVPALFTWDRLAYVTALVLPLPSALLAPRVLAAGLPVLLANLLSSHHYQHRIEYHYTAYLIPVVVIAAVHGAHGLAHRPAWARRGVTVLAAVAVVAHVVAAPFPLGARAAAWRGPEPNRAAYEAAIERIGPDDVVAATSRFVVHLTHRPTVYLFPNPWLRHNYAWPGADLPAAASVEWVLATTTEIPNDHLAVLDRLIGSPAFDVIIDHEAFVLLRRRS